MPIPTRENPVVESEYVMRKAPAQAKAIVGHSDVT